MAADCRFSVADSEWSRDGSEGEARYVACPAQDFHADRRMYDIPPHMEGRAMLSSVNQTESSAPNTEKRGKSPTSAEVKTRGGDSGVSSFCIKMYLVGLTMGFVTLICVVVYLVMMVSSLSNAQAYCDEKINSSSSQYANDVENLREQLKATQSGQREIMQTMHEIWTTPRKLIATTPTTNHNGCTSGHSRSNNSCFFVQTSTKGIINTASMVECWRLKSGAKLASFRQYNVKAILGNRLPAGQYWIDGFRSTPSDGFRYQDHTAMNSTWLTGTKGDCVSLSVTEVTTRWHKTSCYDILQGFICQYAVAN